ncbi:hypothetical protein ACFX1T_039395 [Malus domestica]
MGLVLHCHAIQLGWESYNFVQNGLIHYVVTWTALINGYMKSGQVEVARELFDEMPNKNAVLWNAMINGYVQVGLFSEGLELFVDMQVYRVLPNHAGIVGALTACAFLGALDQGRWMHAYVSPNGVKKND